MLTTADQKIVHNDTYSLLLEKFASKNFTLGVLGLGYVGLPLSLAFAETGVKVIGFDSDKGRVDDLNSGINPLTHTPPTKLRQNLTDKTFRATFDVKEISECDAIVICLPTPLNKNLEPDLSYIKSACQEIAPHLKSHVLVSLESTTWPGTTEEVVKPLLEKGSSLKAGDTLYLIYSPEREDPGNKTYTTKNIPKLIGGYDQKSLDLGIAFYSTAIDTVVPMSSLKTAESTKLYENIFRSVNIALVNELKVIFQKMGIDIWEVVEGASTKPFGFMPFYPGPGLGGHCIPVDPYYLSWKAKEFGLNARFIELAGEINRSMPQYVVSRVQASLNASGLSIKGAKILVLGVSYKPNVPDLRESPSLKLIELLEQEGASVSYHDPWVPMIGATRDYPQLKGKKSVSLDSSYDLFLLATNHTLFDPEEILSFGVPIVDTRNFIPRQPSVTQG